MHCINLQHCIACSAVAIGAQSNAKAPRATVSTAEKIDLPNTTPTSLEAFVGSVKLTCGIAPVSSACWRPAATPCLDSRLSCPAVNTALVPQG